MAPRPLTLTRPAIFRARDLQAIELAAIRVLETVGIEVCHADLMARARKAGLTCRDGRIRLPRRQVSSFIEETRGGRRSPRRHRPAPLSTPVRLHLGLSGYPQHVHDPGADRIAPFTAARLTEAAKLVAMLQDRGLSPSAPGCPTDVPAPLQPLLQYRIAVENIPGALGPVDPKHGETLPYLMAMAEAAGHPIRSLPVYVFTPLRLTGESLSALISFESRLDDVYVAAMPSAGCTAPVRPAEGFALAAAEVIGAALILRECFDLKVGWGISLYPFDLRGMAMSFGSPESLLFQAASNEVDAYFHGRDWWPAVGNIHTLAKHPGPQAAAEKMSIMLPGALWGGRHFGCAGSLSLDELFSPVQLLVDIELKDHVERLLAGLDTGLDAEACLQDVQEGMEQGFVGLERTLDRYRDLYWHPRLFERRFLGPWQTVGSPSFDSQARHMIAELIARWDYRPPADVSKELEEIYRRAERDLAQL